ncbi:hypothetical protein [Denitratimonas sp. CY0512]|uniref:hypothetical protein n=1 Tax=Denitratimonas sp. CY0512 TaxID=3131940 RepID=UPI0030B6C2DB
MKSDPLLVDAVIDAARQVVQRWEHGDLAEAVRELDQSLQMLDTAGSANSANILIGELLDQCQDDPACAQELRPLLQRLHDVVVG